MLDLIHFLDIGAGRWAMGLRGPFLTDFFQIITYFGQWHVVILLAIFLSFLVRKHYGKKEALLIWLLVAGTSFTVSILKFLVHRDRPADSMYLEVLPSFPSWHAAISLAFYGLAAFFFWRLLKNRAAKVVSLSCFVFLITAISFSRLYLGVHYLSDIIAGLLTGGAWLGLVIYAIMKILCRPVTEN